MSQALYRKYRSRSLDELVGQTHVTDVLKRALEKDQLSHAYLLTGPRGVGKTSIARILAHEINHVAYTDDTTDLDIIEIDAASNRRIDDIRDLREKVHIAPSRSKYKVYIIDEVHMLTGESFNALLKTLEEPPAHVIFILATTEIDKLPATITSRAQTFHFRRIAPDVMVAHLRMIADKESLKIDDGALETIAAHADGSLRDAETALDQIRHAAEGTITQADAELTLGSVSKVRIDDLLTDIQKTDAPAVAALLTQAESDGISPVLIARALGSRLMASTPGLDALNLIDALLEVPKSYSPAMKLFSVLMRASTAHKPAAAFVATPVIREQKPEPKQKPAPEPEAVAAASDELKTSPPLEETGEENVAVTASGSATAVFDWDTLIAHIKKNFIALHAVLSKCQYTYDGDTLTLYSKFKLHKTKLDDGKYRDMLNEALKSLNTTAPAITILFGAKPIADENLAGIAALMGGGEEYSEEKN